MKCLLLVLGVALLCGTRAMDIPRAVDIPRTMAELDLEKVAGTWHTVGMASSDLDLLETPDAPLRVYIKEVWPTPDGNLEVLLSKQEDGKCVEKKILAEKTQDPARFRIDVLDQGQVFVLDAKDSSFLILCVESQAVPEQQLTCQALARTQQGDPEVMGKFKMALETLPVTMRIFLDLTQGKEKCRV